MHCVVTAGPTFEALDEVRRLTNFSTGRLGVELARHLAGRGHTVTLLLGEQATYRDTAGLAGSVTPFTTTSDLRAHLQALGGGGGVAAVFHAAAVSDFTFGKVWVRNAAGALSEVRAGKLSTREGTLLAELLPTPKIITELRGWYPRALLVGWKYEVEGGRAELARLAARQFAECGTDLCVVNGRAYGEGFGVAQPDGACPHCADRAALFHQLEQRLALRAAN